MDVLVVGGGGREHALAWKCAKSPMVDRVYVAPGNAGTALEPRLRNIDIGAEDVDALLAFALREAIGLTVVGPEAPLVAGISDRFEAAGLPCFGPTRDGAELEGSKAFAKAFLDRHGIATAAYGVYEDFAAASDAIPQLTPPVVIKADGLAAGKGVVIAKSHAEAIDAAKNMLVGGVHADAGRRIVVEEFLTGEEASFIAIVDGNTVVPLATSQDHKARDDGDEGPNTGGMGAYSPAPIVDASMHARIMSDIIEPTVAGLAADGIRYTGFLYAGLMIGADGCPQVLEYNCRFGDPETQPIMMRLTSDLVPVLLAAANHSLSSCANTELSWDSRASVGVVMAAGGYPGTYARGHQITGLPAIEQDDATVKVFHAGSRLAETSDASSAVVETSGGRVLCVTALGASVTDAQATAYKAVADIHWPDAHYRRDIGYRAMARERA